MAGYETLKDILAVCQTCLVTQDRGLRLQNVSIGVLQLSIDNFVIAAAYLSAPKLRLKSLRCSRESAEMCGLP